MTTVGELSDNSQLSELSDYCIGDNSVGDCQLTAVGLSGLLSDHCRCDTAECCRTIIAGHVSSA